MELRRKEHAIRQVSKQMSYMESEKNTLMGRLSDAEKTMTAAARLLNFCYVSLRNLSQNFSFYLGFKHGNALLNVSLFQREITFFNT